MDSKNNQINQIDKSAEVLLGLKRNISSEDRKEAMAKFNITAFTVSTYLNGKGKDLSTAEKLIVFFRKVIAKRDEVLSA